METKEEVRFVGRTSKTGRFDKRQILEIVRAVESGIPRKELLWKYGMSTGSLAVWMSRYGSDHYHNSLKQRSFKLSEKRSVIRAVESGMNVREAAVAFGIGNVVLIQRWIQKYSRENAELAINLPPLKEKKKKPSLAEQQSLEQQLAQAQLKIHALETMIDIAEEQLKIDIRKKSGAKQSPK
jgi:transposase